MEKINMQSLALNHSCVYNNNELALFTDFSSIKKAINEKFYIEGMLVVLMKKGLSRVMIDGEVSDFYEGDLFCCKPNILIDSAMVSIDMDAYVLFISPDYAIDLVSKSGIDWTSIMLKRTKECIHLKPERMEDMESFFSLLKSFIESTDSPHKEQRISALMLTLVYTLCDMVPISEMEVHNQSYSSRENLMERFLKMLRDSQPNGGRGHKYLNVTGYAEKLNVTPKYFSTVCRETMGKTAGQIINDEIIRSAKILLHDNTKSIKQISMLLGFANQSHFGTYFNRKTGMSPQQFRNSNQ